VKLWSLFVSRECWFLNGQRQGANGGEEAQSGGGRGGGKRDIRLQMKGK
jgi:hypothetical protein